MGNIWGLLSADMNAAAPWKTAEREFTDVNGQTKLLMANADGTASGCSLDYASRATGGKFKGGNSAIDLTIVAGYAVCARSKNCERKLLCAATATCSSPPATTSTHTTL